ncbi:MAG: PsiF family protein [Xanthobacteraceae bacterium]|jgi:hypothetical protein
MKLAISMVLLALTIGTVGALAQTPPPAPPPATQSAAPAAGAAVDKKAISKDCSQQADAKGLKGKERKKFRSSCKKSGGKSPS